ncbi:MAG: hypothetical protein ACHBN1_28365 [Heteroscytonema crispum UTEX LB 1556]
MSPLKLACYTFCLHKKRSRQRRQGRRVWRDEGGQPDKETGVGRRVWGYGCGATGVESKRGGEQCSKRTSPTQNSKNSAKNREALLCEAKQSQNF